MLSRFVTPSGRARAVASEEGLTLIEVMIAVFVLAVAVLALASTAIASLTSLRTNRERSQATSATSAAIEEVRSLSYSEIAHPSGEVTGSTDPDYVNGTDPAFFAHDGDEDEEIVTSASGEVSPHRWTSADGQLTVRIFVTWYDDDDPISATGRDAKRVTAIATWVDPQTGPGEVRQSTVVAAASRGLPVPRFDITPDESERFIPPDRRVCFSHVLRNSGATDTYDWALLKDDGSTATFVNEHTMRHKAWRAQAWFGEPQYNDDGSVDTTADNLWRHTTRDQRPDSPTAVTSGSAEILTVCFRSNSSAEDYEANPRFTFVVRSGFDPDVARHVITDIDTTRPSHQLFLHNDPDNLSDHERELGEADPMDPVTPIQEDADGTIIDELFSYDTNIEPDIGGIRLAENETGATDGSEHTGIWTYHGFGAGTEIGEGELDLWLWHGQPAEEDASFSVGFALDVIGEDGAVQQLAVDPSSVTYGPSEDWQRVSVAFDLEDFTFATSEEHLRLRLWCESDAGAHCQLAYDTNTRASSLTVRAP